MHKPGRKSKTILLHNHTCERPACGRYGQHHLIFGFQRVTNDDRGSRAGSPVHITAVCQGDNRDEAEKKVVDKIVYLL